MANAQKIDELIDQKAFDQLTKLQTELDKTKNGLAEAILAAEKFSSAISSVKGIKDLNAVAESAAKAQTKIADSAEKTRLAELKLEAARRKAFDDFEKRMARQQAAENRAAAATEKSILAQVRAAEAARAANAPYNKLNAELGVLRTRARDIGVEFGTNSRQFREAAASVQILDRRLRDIDNQLGQNQRNVGNYSSALEGLNKNFVAFGAAMASLSGVKKIAMLNAEIDDALSDVRRTAGLTAAEAENLSNQLKKIDTRTSLKGLLEIAAIGGQLGIAKNDLAGFTKAVDQLSVTLASEIPGGAEAVATSLGKINGVFKVQQKEGTNTEQSLNKTGSAILALGQAGLATGAFLQDFTLRTAGTAQVAKISLPTILAYSAVLEETGSSAEVAGTAFNKLVGGLASKREQFFKIAQLANANLTLKDFTKTINTDANKALQEFFAGLNKGGSNLTSFTDLLDTLKIKGGPAKNAIIALAQNQGLLNERIVESTDAYRDGTLAAEQFKLKNDNLAGSIEKLINLYTNESTSAGIANFFKQAVDGAADFSRELFKLVNSRSWTEFFSRAGLNPFGTSSSTYDKINGLKDRLETNQQTAFTIDNTPNLLNKSAKELKELYSTAKQAAIGATRDYNTFNNAIKTGELSDDGKLKDYRQTADILVKQANNIAVAYMKARDSVKQTKSGDVDISGALANEKAIKAAEAKRIKLLAESYKAEQELSVADLEAQYKIGGQDLTNTADFEKEKLKVITDGIDKRQSLYKKDSTEYKRLEKEKTSAATSAQININKDIQKQLDDGYKLLDDNQKKEIQSVKDSNSEKLSNIELTRAKTSQILSDQYADGLISKKKYDQELLEIDKQAFQDSLQIQIDALKKIIELEKNNNNDVLGVNIDTNKQIGDDEKKLAELEISLSRSKTDEKIKGLQLVADARKDLQDKEFQAGHELLSFTSAIADGIFTRRLNGIQSEIDANDKKKAADIENVNNSVLSEEEKANKIAIINARADAQQALLEQKQRDIKTKQAKFDKVASIANILLNTAQAEVQALSYLSNPFTAPLYPGIAAIIGTIGALQLATVLATPLPTYFTGTDNSKAGLALTDELGPELYIEPGGNTFIGSNKPNIKDLKAGTQIIPHHELIKMIAKPELNVMASNSFDFSLLIMEQRNSTKELKKAFKSQKQPVFRHSKRGFFADSERISSINQYLRRNF